MKEIIGWDILFRDLAPETEKEKALREHRAKHIREMQTRSPLEAYLSQIALDAMVDYQPDETKPK